MSLEITRVGLSHDQSNSLACGHLEAQIDGTTHHLPALCASYADYDHARKAKLPLHTDIFNYHHDLHDSHPITARSVQNNIAQRITLTRDSHQPSITSISLQHSGNLTDAALGAFHTLQERLGLQIITTVEKDPYQDLASFREELEQFNSFPTDSIRSPSITMEGDLEDFKDKLQYIVKNYGRFNLQWGGLKYSDKWQLLSSVLRDHDVWCNVIGIMNKFQRISVDPKQYVQRSNIVLPLLSGAHTYCFSWLAYPRHFGHNDTPTSKIIIPKTSITRLFNPQTWCYDKTQLAVDTAHVHSFNAIQNELEQVRAHIDNGTLYGDYCLQKPALNVTVNKISES